MRTYLPIGLGLAIVVTVSLVNGADKETSLTFNAEITKVEATRGAMHRIFFEATDKNLGIGKSDLHVNIETKFIFDDENGSRAVAHKKVLTDETVKEYLEAGKIIRVTAVGGNAKEIRFGPNATNPKKKLEGSSSSKSSSPSVPDDKKDDPNKDEMAKLEGTYTCVSTEQDGMKADAEQIKKLKLVVKDKKWSVYINDKVSTIATFTVDPSKKPKAIDMTGTQGGDKGVKYLAIYELKGDDLKLCIGDTKSRPTVFDAKKDSGRQLEVWKRTKE
jgi:uncharacterized protein (TIGR03067 family)